MLLDLANCPKHGWLSHAVIHEAGHAVAAIRLDFDFIAVTVPPPAESLLVARGHFEAAGVQMPSANPKDWAGDRYQDAAVFLLAGTCAEEAGFAHTLASSPTGDMNVFANLTTDLSKEESLRYIEDGTPLARDFVQEHFADISRVARMLSEGIHADADGRYFGFDTALNLTYDEVRALVMDGA